MDEFEQDSFVVGNSVVEYESSLDELDMVDGTVCDLVSVSLNQNQRLWPVLQSVKPLMLSFYSHRFYIQMIV